MTLPDEPNRRMGACPHPRGRARGASLLARFMDLPRVVCDPRVARPCGTLQTNGDRCCVGRDSSHSVHADLYSAVQPGRQATERWACTLRGDGVRRNVAVVLVLNHIERRVD